MSTSKAHTAALIITRENKIAVELIINSDDAKSVFNELVQNKDSVEAIIGEKLDWREMPEKKASRIVLFYPVDPYDEVSWLTQFKWLQSKLEKFDVAFRPLLTRKLPET